MLKLIKAFALAATLAIAVSGCTTVVPAKLDPEALIPMALTTCADAPTVPSRPAPNQPRTDSQKAEYLTQVRAYGDDCKGTVNAIAVRRQKLDAQAGVKTQVPAQTEDGAPAKPTGFHLNFHIPFLGAKPVVAPSPTPAA